MEKQLLEAKLVARPVESRDWWPKISGQVSPCSEPAQAPLDVWAADQVQLGCDEVVGFSRVRFLLKNRGLINECSCVFSLLH